MDSNQPSLAPGTRENRILATSDIHAAGRSWKIYGGIKVGDQLNRNRICSSQTSIGISSSDQSRTCSFARHQFYNFNSMRDTASLPVSGTSIIYKPRFATPSPALGKDISLGITHFGPQLKIQSEDRAHSSLPRSGLRAGTFGWEDNTFAGSYLGHSSAPRGTALSGNRNDSLLSPIATNEEELNISGSA